MNEAIIQLSYFVASFLFIYGLRCLGHPKTGRRGILLAEIGMFIAVVGTLLHHEIITFQWIIGGLVLGTVIGIPMGLWIPMTKMPERIALSHSFGGLAVALVGVVEYIHLQLNGPGIGSFAMGAVGFEVLLGTLTFTGSLMAFGKLQGVISGRPITFKFQNFLNVALLLGAVGMVIYLISHQQLANLFLTIAVIGLALGISLVLPIGGADMPVVICLLNSYAGLAAAASGFALNNKVLIICGALDGGSGFILGMLMSKAMNRSFGNVIFGAFGTDGGAIASASGQAAPISEVNVQEAAEILQAASSVVIVPGYGLAVAQAQHTVRELTEALEKNGTDVKFAIHPVAGRMPGHMNVLLAEANVPYEQLIEMDEINPQMDRTDVAMVIGANDVVNPAAREDKGSPIYGMPIINVDMAKTVFVLKRSMASGFAGIENPLFHKPNTRMLFGDAKKSVQALVNELKSSD